MKIFTLVTRSQIEPNSRQIEKTRYKSRLWKLKKKLDQHLDLHSEKLNLDLDSEKLDLDLELFISCEKISKILVKNRV